MNKEQRTYLRRISMRNVYAALGRDYEKVGKLIDLSPGGMAFEYVSNDNPISEFSQVDIFEVGKVVNIRNLPCRIAYDIALPLVRDGIKSLKNARNRRCGVEFKNLSEEENAQLALFLESHTEADQ